MQSKSGYISQLFNPKIQSSIILATIFGLSPQSQGSLPDSPHVFSKGHAQTSQLSQKLSPPKIP